MLFFLSFLAISCSKEKPIEEFVEDKALQKNADNLQSEDEIIAEEMNTEYEQYSSDEGVIISKAALPQDCCECNLIVWSNGPSTYTGNTFSDRQDNWSAQVIFENCNDGSSDILDVGYSQVPALTYPTPGTSVSYPFTVPYGSTSIELRTYIGRTYAQLPVTVRSKVICERAVPEPYVIPQLEITCDDVGNDSPQGCGDLFVSPQYVNEYGGVEDCGAGRLPGPPLTHG